MGTLINNLFDLRMSADEIKEFDGQVRMSWKVVFFIGCAVSWIMVLFLSAIIDGI